MIINSVKIENFRQFRDIVIDFAKERNKNFTIIRGSNGTGKTTLLNALSWCLYGEEIHDYGDETSMGICNNKTFNLSEDGENFKIMVEIEFLEDNNEILSFRRTLELHKKEGSIIPSPWGEKFEVIKQEGNNVKTFENDVYTIERKIPKDIEDYFFFDGARLGEYFQKNSNKKIKESVFNLSQLNLVENSHENLGKVIKKYNDKLKKIYPEIGKANEKIIYYKSEIQKSENELEQSKKIVKEAKGEIERIEAILINKNSTNIEKLIIDDQNLKKDIDTLKSEISDLENKREKMIITNYPYLFAYDMFNNFLQKGEDSRQKGFIPPKFKKNFIEDLLGEGKCICGLDLKTHEKNREKLEFILENTSEITNKSEDISAALASAKNINFRIKNIKERIIYTKKVLANKKESYDEKREERKRISSQLEANPYEDIRKLKDLKYSYENEEDKNSKNIGRLEAHLENLNKKIGKYKQAKIKEDGLKIQAKEYNEKILFCQKAQEAAYKINKELTDEIREKIQELTKQKFIKIQWKEEEFNDIFINKNYEVFITNKSGHQERPGDLSDGEKLCLGLCFMSALHNISGFDLPIIMDTPLGNLDEEMRHNIAEFLPGFVGDKQTILLVTGTEYTTDFRDTLYNNIGKEYNLVFENSEKGKESKVILNG